MSSKPAFKVLGRDTPRQDGVAKVTGREIFASDMTLPNMLYGRILKSPYAHAKVKSMDVSKAEAMGAVTLTPDEIPDVKYCPRLVSVPSSTYKDWKVLADKGHYVGEPIAAVAAESEEEAQRAMEAIEVEYGFWARPSTPSTP
jgi:xanthine dehydrogenase molybdenum-binding subunit